MTPGAFSFRHQRAAPSIDYSPRARNRRQHRARHVAGSGARLGAPQVRQSALVREEVYLMHSSGPVDLLWQELHAIRLLVREKAFAIAAVLSLMLGIGANTAIFQLLDAIRLRTLPVDGPNSSPRCASAAASAGPGRSTVAAPISRSRCGSGCAPTSTPSTTCLRGAPGGSIRRRPAKCASSRGCSSAATTSLPSTCLHTLAGCCRRPTTAGVRAGRRGHQPRLLAARVGRRPRRALAHDVARWLRVSDRRRHAGVVLRHGSRAHVQTWPFRCAQTMSSVLEAAVCDQRDVWWLAAAGRLGRTGR